ncbi:MAG: hypothetical protein ACREB9_03970 [Thermoplasmata archaeon]
MSTATQRPSIEFDHLPEVYDPHAFVPRRPIGLAIFCTLMAAAAVALVLASIFYLIGTYATGWLPSGALPDSLTVLRGLTPLSAGVLLVFSGSMIGVATALWRQETWALATVLVVVTGGLIYLLSTATFTVLMVVLALVFLYLVAVREYFY